MDPPPKKSKQSTKNLTLGPFDSISHKELRDHLSQSENLKLNIESGSADSIFIVKSVDLKSLKWKRKILRFGSNRYFHKTQLGQKDQFYVGGNN